jgi:hypothetical protein
VTQHAHLEPRKRIAEEAAFLLAQDLGNGQHSVRRETWLLTGMTLSISPQATLSFQTQSGRESSRMRTIRLPPLSNSTRTREGGLRSSPIAIASG